MLRGSYPRGVPLQPDVDVEMRLAILEESPGIRVMGGIRDGFMVVVRSAMKGSMAVVPSASLDALGPRDGTWQVEKTC